MFRGGIGPTEILLILGVVVLLFGGKKLPELARGSGKALRIFKTEVTSLTDNGKDDDEDDDDTQAAKKKPQPAALEVVEVPDTVEKKPEQG
ncbi:twin-arginine translocase TatA/TatE family subunit [Aeromicrobium sp. CF3.5]|uniref:twin-arginine translocase TatA/TatE family subunit n=1 Tax=Aeromicrobium sp. CF3.5 TaxID=3373078 RepID=UPI003EE64784